MTTIAISETHIAADSRATRNHEIASWQVRKIEVVEHAAGGRIYALSGEDAMTKPAIEWHQDGAEPAKVPKGDPDTSWTLLVIEKDGRVIIYGDKSPYPLEVTAPYTMGSGRDFAMGAMLAGASAKEAVEIACTRDVWSGLPVQVVDIAQALGVTAVKEAAE
jgi:hypothetical protein